MTKIYNGRYTAVTEEGMVVFLVGMRVNKWWAVHRWWPVFMSMRNMIIDLETHPEKGMAASHTRVSWREVVVATYWRSYDKLESYARAPGDIHMPYWRAYNKDIGSSGIVGIWHESFVIQPGNYECVYVNMPVSGLARSNHISYVKAEQKLETSRSRIGRGHNRPAVPASPTPDES